MTRVVSVLNSIVFVRCKCAFVELRSKTFIIIVVLQLEDSYKTVSDELEDLKNKKDALNEEVKQLREGL